MNANSLLLMCDIHTHLEKSKRPGFDKLMTFIVFLESVALISSVEADRFFFDFTHKLRNIDHILTKDIDVSLEK